MVFKKRMLGEGYIVMPLSDLNINKIMP